MCRSLEVVVTSAADCTVCTPDRDRFGTAECRERQQNLNRTAPSAAPPLRPMKVDAIDLKVRADVSYKEIAHRGARDTSGYFLSHMYPEGATAIPNSSRTSGWRTQQGFITFSTATGDPTSPEKECPASGHAIGDQPRHDDQCNFRAGEGRPFHINGPSFSLIDTPT
ncbi:hypothetical protein I7G60_32330 [Sinorhizobium meliloti]|uniref:hypothetical protein n=1 Tax=Rhizobium meliloti TaxID=382 RepID=UPI002380A1A9|nr:hypothetical protein [Sinorhizobium meliloti]MDE3762630.1 hypothetical protein [Sinorhizobium meliloti]